MNMMKMMKQAQELQAKAAKLQADLASRHYEAEAAGGQIKAVATGEGQLVSLKIDPEGMVITEVRRGYKLGEKLLRPAQVIVSSGPMPTPADTAAAPAEPPPANPAPKALPEESAD